MKYLKTYENLFSFLKPKIKIGELYSYKIRKLRLHVVVKCEEIIVGQPTLISEQPNPWDLAVGKKEVSVSGYHITASRWANSIGQSFSDNVEYELLKPANKKEIEFYKYCELENATNKYNL